MTIIEKDETLRIEWIETAPFGTNAYIIICNATAESVLIDAPGDADKILDQLEGTKTACILMTHKHMDHTGALSRLKDELSIPVAAHPADATGLPVTAEMLLTDGNIVSFGNVTLEVLHTPGHTPGSLCFLTGKTLISGDTIFPGGPGKTGTPSDFEQIVESIKHKILVLPDDVRIYPGHGKPTVLKKEKDEFTIFSSKAHAPNLCGDVLWLKD
ncbi:MAG: MBL fold metallo-hydrolase [Candidatus Aminicenantes bacterium]|nr:MBL fold metallo-hydrolase [Candidatus Aminicenantes bacterium]